MHKIADTLSLFRRGRTVAWKHNGEVIGTIDGTALIMLRIRSRTVPALRVSIRVPGRSLNMDVDSRNLTVI